MSCPKPPDQTCAVSCNACKRIDALFSQRNVPGSPGAAVAVVRNGEVIFKRGYGYANLEYSVPNSPSTIFHVASVSKQFTAASIALLATSGEIALSDNIRKYVPEVPDFGVPITIRHLVHHVSGLRDQWELLRLSGWRMDDVITLDHILKTVRLQRELNFPPGNEYLYCNTGYTLLAEIVARVSGQKFRDFTRAHIFEPLGMSRTHFHDDHEEIVPGRAYSYAPKTGGGFKHSVLSYANVGATSLFTTVEDLALWLHNLNTKVVLGPDVIDLMHQRYVLNSGKQIDYAFGLAFEKYRGLELVGHSGSDAGYRTYCCRSVDHGYGFVVLSNLSTFVPRDLALGTAEIFLGDHMTEPEKETSALPDDPEAEAPDLTAFAGKYLVTMIGRMVTVSVDGDKLRVSIEGEPEADLTRKGALTFASPTLKSLLVFQRDESGKVSAFTATLRNMSLTGRRLVDERLSQCKLVEYAGNYYSAELDTTYTIEAAGNDLWMRHRRLDDMELVRAGDDVFLARRTGAEFRFVRSQGRVSGLMLTSNRVRDLRFQRS